MTQLPTTPIRVPADDSRPRSADPTVADTPPPSGPETVGTRVGRYELSKLLGRGGMGCVYLGWDAQLRRKVAVKVLLPEVAGDAESRARFLREARAAAAVTHDHIVAVYEAGQDGDTAYMAMPYLPGMTLQQYLDAKGRPPIPVAVRIAREVASGLVAAHAAGLLHRDIKPGNVLLEAPKGRVKILDFGLAAPFAPDDAKLTQTGLVVGTPAYMSPEQARGWKTDHRTDLFSLGVVLYQLCTGRPPFTGTTTMDVLTALATEAPVSASKRNAEIPLRLELLLDRLLDKNPAGRPQSAAEVVADLRSIERELGERRSGPVLDAEVVRVPGPSPVAEEAGEVAADEVVETPPPKRRGSRPRTKTLTRRARQRKQARQRRVFVAAVVGTLLVCVAVVGLAASRLFGPKVPSADPAGPPPTSAPENESTPVEPQPRPMPPPPWWRPGMPLPPEFHRPPR
jgi:serine/threonine protein kinase